MSYIGKAPGFGIRNRYYYTATSSQTLFSGADDNGQTLAYADSKYLDVYLNGVLLVAGTDYTATTLTSVSLTTGAAASDIVEIVAYDIFSVADTVSAANGGTFSGAITVDADGATVATFDRATSDGDIVSFEKDGSTVGSIGSVSGVTAYIDGGSGFSGIQFGGDGLAPRDNGALADNTSDLGTSSYRFKDLYLSGGVYLGGTGAANYLDDYEEGTWTPSLIGSTSDPSGTYSNQSGKYTKTGNKVFAQFQLVLNSGFSNGSGQIRVSGLPFNSNFETMTGNVALEQFSDKVDNHCTPVMANGSSQVRFLSMNLSGGWSYIQWGDNTSATLYVFGSVSYTTDS